MKIKPNYSDSAFIVPGSVIGHLTDSNATPIAPLLYALSKIEFSVAQAAADLRISEAEFVSALTYWESTGAISLSVSKCEITDTAAPKKRMKKVNSHPNEHAQSSEDSNVTETGKRASRAKSKLSSELPTYTTEETARFLEENRRTAEIIDSCENIIGKIFTTAETSIIVAMLDHLSLSGEYIMLLFAHAVKMGKKSVRYIEKLALSLVDRDITTYAELEEELARRELTESTLKEVRRLFGIGSRAFTAKEQQIVRNWCVTWNFGIDVITRAYEITANSTGDASFPYANAILSSWHDAGLCSAEEVDAYIEQQNAKRVSDKSADNSSSFDTDDFFEAALKRSYGN